MAREVPVLGIDIGSQEWKRMTNFHIWSHDLRLGLDLDTAGTQVCLDEEWLINKLIFQLIDGCYGPRFVHSSPYSQMSGVALLGHEVIAQHVIFILCLFLGLKTQIYVTSDDPRIHTGIWCFFLYIHISGESIHNFIRFMWPPQKSENHSRVDTDYFISGPRTVNDHSVSADPMTWYSSSFLFGNNQSQTGEVRNFWLILTFNFLFFFF